MDKEIIENNQQLQEDEIIVLSSIYESDTFYQNPSSEKNKGFIFKLSVITEDDIKDNNLSIKDSRFLYLNIFYPSTYPSNDPPIYEINCTWVEKSIEISIDEKYKQIISDKFMTLWNELKGEVIVFEWLQCLTDYIESELKLELIQDIKKTENQSKSAFSTPNFSSENSLSSSPTESTENLDNDLKQLHISSSSFSSLPIPDGVEMPVIYSSEEPIVDRKSVFIAHLAPIKYTVQIGMVLKSLLANKKIAKATHNMYAYRIQEQNGVINEGNDEDGEHGAGIILTNLLEVLDAKNVLVVVSRWYGGIKLGPDRFKHIKDSALQLLDEHNYVEHKKTLKDIKNKKKKNNKK